MSKALFAALVCGMLQAAVCSQAWSEFMASKKAPSGSRRLMAAGLGNTKPAGFVQIQPIEGCGTKATSACPKITQPQAAYVTVNEFVAKNQKGDTKASQIEIQKRIWQLCKKGAAGTSFSQVAQSKWSAGVANPECYYCFGKGYGVDSSTPGYYLPCGCQRTCVDVSGNSVGSYQSKEPKKPKAQQFFGLGDSNNGGFPYLSNSFGSNGVYGTGTGTFGQKLNTCQDYIDNRMVTTCNEIFIYHFVLWPSVLGVLALFYAVYSIAFMSLDMDSLLYTVGSSHKKND